MITVIIPAYKEYENLKTLIPEIRDTLNGDLHDIIVVDDNSGDGTEGLDGARIVTRKSERGLSSAVIRGIEECEPDGFVVMDADHQHLRTDAFLVSETARAAESRECHLHLTSG